MTSLKLTPAQAKRVIVKYIHPAEIIGDVKQFGDMWRALVTIRPSGPLLLMEFHLTQTESKSMESEGK